MIAIALAEDNLQIRGLIVNMISKLVDYSVSIEASNGFQLLEKLNATNQIPAFAILDIEMSVMDGLATTNYLSIAYPDIKVLVISYHKDPGIVKEILEAGAKGFVIKENLSEELLLNAFNNINVGNPFIDEALGDKEFYISATAPVIKTNNSPHCAITQKERMFLQLLSTSLSFEQIAELMNVSKDTVYNYPKTLKEKIGTGSRHELMMYALQQGIAKQARFNNYPPPVDEQGISAIEGFIPGISNLS